MRGFPSWLEVRDRAPSFDIEQFVEIQERVGKQSFSLKGAESVAELLGTLDAEILAIPELVAGYTQLIEPFAKDVAVGVPIAV
ncbi:hypothetical protein [Thermogutta sp.]|uniref:hypothetical protein n=1 Tax=Thermogutta sp. TaxID=1962930 RepID=UPI00321FDE52